MILCDYRFTQCDSMGRREAQAAVTIYCAKMLGPWNGMTSMGAGPGHAAHMSWRDHGVLARLLRDLGIIKPQGWSHYIVCCLRNMPAVGPRSFIFIFE